MKIDRNPKICTPDKNVLSVHLSNFTHVCRYYKYPKRRHFNNSTLAPKGMCIDLFHSAYPACLSMLYGARYDNKVIVSCPNPDSNISIEIKMRLSKTRMFRKFIVWLFRKLGRITEIPCAEINMSIMNNSTPSCKYVYKKGQTFSFNTWLGRELCPATFDALYPPVHNLMRDGCVPWRVNPLTNKIVCPDPKSNIAMSITREADTL